MIRDFSELKFEAQLVPSFVNVFGELKELLARPS